jgi:hypothetical protein
LSPRLLASKLGPALSTAQLVGWLLLLRSVAFDRWMTVAVAVLMLVGVRAAMRERTWGVVLAFAAAVWLPAAVFLGMAPPWFLLAGVLGMLPFLKTWPSLRALDKGAASLLATLAGGLGVAGALAWKSFAPALFWSVPALRPTFLPGHGFAVAAILALAATLAVRDRRARDRALAGSAGSGGVRVAASDDEPARLRVGDEMRVASLHDAPDEIEQEAAHDLERALRREPEPEPEPVRDEPRQKAL